MKLKLMMATLVAAFSVNAVAGFMVEPYVGVGQYATTADLASTEVSGENYQTVGGRLGYSFLLFSGGLDYEMMNFDDGTLNNTSFFVGVDLPILFRFYGKYIFNSSSDVDSDGTTIDLEFQDGYVVGAGFTGLPFVVINLEVGALNYTFDISGTDYDYGVATTALTVSLPLP